MSVLGLDISSASCGVAFGGGDGPPRTLRKRLSGPTRGYTGATLLRWVSDLIIMEKPRVVVIEAPLLHMSANRSPDAARMMLGLAFVVETVCASRNVACHDVAVQTWRKSILGRGNIPGKEAKQQALALCRRLGWPTGDCHDRAEAACVWAYAHITYGDYAPVRAALDQAHIDQMAVK